MNPSKNQRGKKKKKKPTIPKPPQIQTLTEVSTSSKPQSKDDETLTLDWLMEAFSSLSLDQISSAYAEAGGDAYKAAGILGAELDDPGEEKEIERMPTKNKKAVVAVAAATGTVSGVIGKGYVGGGGKRGCAGVVEAKGMKDKKYSVEEGEEFLFSMLGYESELGMGVVKDVLGEVLV